MQLTVTQFLIWLIIAIIVGILGELLAGRRAPNGFIGSIVLGFFSILLIVGVFHFSIQGEPTVAGVPVISAIIGSAILVTLWSSLAYPLARRRTL
jgi:uncharacterized membrane protein YeaQ/YmgE (transglycosylase-associated protein family)